MPRSQGERTQSRVRVLVGSVGLACPAMTELDWTSIQAYTRRQDTKSPSSPTAAFNQRVTVFVSVIRDTMLACRLDKY